MSEATGRASGAPPPLEGATELAARTVAAIDAAEKRVPYPTTSERVAADRERVRIDLDGLRECAAYRAEWGEDSAVARLADAVALLFDEGLRRTAAIYASARSREQAFVTPCLCGEGKDVPWNDHDWNCPWFITEGKTL